MSLTELGCPTCGSPNAYFSRRLSFTEKFILPLLFLRPYRCVNCFQRYYRITGLNARPPRRP